MDWETITQFLNTTRGAYAVMGAGALFTLGTGYLFGKMSSRDKEADRNYKLEMGRLDLERGKIDLERAKLSGDPLQLKQMTYDEVARAHERQKELDKIERDNNNQDIDRSRRIQLEDITRDDASKSAERKHRVEVIAKLAETTKPVIEAYARAVELYHSSDRDERVADPELKRKRQDYREELVGKYESDPI